MSDDADYLFALELQNRLNADQNNDSADDIEVIDFKPPPTAKEPLRIKRSNPRSNLDDDFLNRTHNLVHPQWETLDPTPDIHALFGAFDVKFFQSRLKCVTLEWSKRMYSCAGICYSRRNRLGMEVTVRLSEPLLKLRPRKDLVETMLHEMIHAYCFVLNIREGNGGHGPNFKKIMYTINKVAGTNITVYHTFHDEVQLYKQHWWRCNGSCQNRSPFYGYVKRTSNRAPSSNDQWWAAHQESCGGTFMKIKGPEKPPKQNKPSKKNKTTDGAGDLRKFFGNPKGNSNSKPTTNIPFGNNGSKGPVRSNGGGTMLLNPKTVKSSTTNITTPNAPPSSYPGPSWDPFNTSGSAFKGPGSKASSATGGNLNNVRSLSDLSGALSGSGTASAGNASTLQGRGYTLNSSSGASGDASTPTEEVDRKRLREIWSKRFDRGIKDVEPKRPRLTQSDEVIAVGEEDESKAPTNKPRTKWSVVDEEVMIRDQPNEVINLSSGSSSSDDEAEVDALPKRKMPLTQQERQDAIKQEILEDTLNLNDDDIVLIDDEYDDNAVDISAAVELADTSLIDEFFGEDTLLQEFRHENDVVPSGSRYVPNPDHDIITCPICQGKMQRSLFANHLDGCTGIAVRILPPTAALKKLSANSREAKSTRKPRASNVNTKDLLRKAGYTEQDLLDITADEENDVEESTVLPSSSPIEVGSSPGEEDTRRFRQRNLFKTTRQCPKCGTEVDEDWINEHLDDCLKK